jgi:hypothetical protein
MLHRLFYLETALHFSAGTTTHHQERKQMYLQHLVFVRLLLLPAAVEHPCCTWRSHIATDNFYAFPQFRLANSRILSKIVTRFHHFPFFPSHYLLIIPSFNVGRVA